MTKVCGVCNGRKHVLQDGVWKKCRCLLVKRRLRAYREARIPSGHTEGSWQEFFDNCEATNEEDVIDLSISISQMKQLPKTHLFAHSRTQRALSYMMSMFAKDACNAGFSALICDVSELVDRYFERLDMVDPRSREVLILRLGSEPDHKYNAHQIESAIRAASLNGGWVMIGSSMDLKATMACYRSATLEEALTSSFIHTIVTERHKNER